MLLVSTTCLCVCARQPLGTGSRFSAALFNHTCVRVCVCVGGGGGHRFLAKMIAVRDMSGLGYKHVGSKGVTVMTSVLKMMQGAYPEVSCERCARSRPPHLSPRPTPTKTRASLSTE